MTIHLQIPDSIAQALRLPPPEQQQQLTIELATALYARSILPTSSACCWASAVFHATTQLTICAMM